MAQGFVHMQDERKIDAVKIDTKQWIILFSWLLEV